MQRFRLRALLGLSMNCFIGNVSDLWSLAHIQENLMHVFWVLAELLAEVTIARPELGRSFAFDKLWLREGIYRLKFAVGPTMPGAEALQLQFGIVVRADLSDDPFMLEVIGPTHLKPAPKYTKVWRKGHCCCKDPALVKF